ncbi:MAG: hypothetical protein KJO98_07100 [Rhodothermia bacterium]|nr:hypothetical protein [Rhodothermia bacterium]
MTHGAVMALIGGVGLGLAYAAAGYVMSRRALGSPEKFMLWVVGGTVARLAFALAAIAAVIITLPIHRTLFIASFLVIFFAALAAEISMLHRRTR